MLTRYWSSRMPSTLRLTINSAVRAVASDSTGSGTGSCMSMGPRGTVAQTWARSELGSGIYYLRHLGSCKLAAEVSPTCHPGSRVPWRELRSGKLFAQQTLDNFAPAAKFDVKAQDAATFLVIGQIGQFLGPLLGVLRERAVRELLDDPFVSVARCLKVLRRLAHGRGFFRDRNVVECLRPKDGVVLALLRQSPVGLFRQRDLLQAPGGVEGDGLDALFPQGEPGELEAGGLALVSGGQLAERGDVGVMAALELCPARGVRGGRTAARQEEEHDGQAEDDDQDPCQHGILARPGLHALNHAAHAVGQS